MPRPTWKFTPPRRAAFLAALARTGSVSAAARAVGINVSHANHVRRRDPAFGAAWEAAVATAAAALDAVALGRALRGWDEPVYYQGVPVTAVRRYSDKLLMILLRAHAPERFGGKAWREAKDRESMAILIEALAKEKKRVEAGRKARAAQEAAAAATTPETGPR